MDIKQVADAINTLDEVTIKLIEDNVVAFTYEGIAIVATLTDETPARLRFSVDIRDFDFEDDEAAEELLFKLLNLNTEIDPVAAAIDFTDPSKMMIQARTSLRIVDIQDSEIVAEVKGLIGAVGEIFAVVKAATEIANVA